MFIAVVFTVTKPRKNLHPYMGKYIQIVICSYHGTTEKCRQPQKSMQNTKRSQLGLHLSKVLGKNKPLFRN